jgi:hypothetical protein
MNSRIRIALAGAAFVLGSALVLAQAPNVSPGGPAQAVDSQIPGAPPSEGYVWMSGHWTSEGGQWKWLAAHWELPPSRSATWVSGHWVSSSGSWAWVNGAWNVPNAEQAQGGPPQPPGQYGPGGAAAVPSPSSPAPYVDGQYQGQYGPGGVTRAIDESASTTDYGPIDYSQAYYPGYAYPGYYYAGDPWFWGFPVALGFGFGPGFRAFGHGGFGHFGRGGFGHGGFGGHFAGGHLSGGHH